MKRLLLVIQLMLVSCATFAQVEWTDFKDLQNLYKENKKGILIFIHTDWCKICKMQEMMVFNDKELSKVLNENYYLLKLNAEAEKDVVFFGRKYKGATSNHFHELAEYLGKSDGGLNFPTTIVLNKHLQISYKNAAFVSKAVFWDLLGMQ